MDIIHATDQEQWDSFLSTQTYRPFLQSWTMGEVYRSTGQDPLRLQVMDDGKIVGICQAIVVPARRGRHLAIHYGPILSKTDEQTVSALISALKDEAQEYNCSFVRMSPFWIADTAIAMPNTKASPLHLLSEHLWYIPLTTPSLWSDEKTSNEQRVTSNESDLMIGMRKNTRNLIRRAEKEGVTIKRCSDPLANLEPFIALHEETRRRHKFTPYTNAFFRAQVEHFSARNECTMYQAWYNNEVIASSIHMHAFGETSYHHGASTHKYDKIPASYLLQWTAITDALKRGDHVYNFWGIAPVIDKENGMRDRNHPFAGVTTFKTGFGGELLELTHCKDIPVNNKYYATRALEIVRKWKRGF